MIRAAAIGLCLAAGTAGAVELELPQGAQLGISQDSSPDSYALPTARVTDGVLPVELVSGAVSRRAWRIESVGVTTLQLYAPLAAQLEAAGFETVFACETETCGGFDFRFETEILPAPDMHVNLSDFRFVSTRRTSEAGAEYVAVLVSRSSAAGYVQIISVSPAGSPAVVVVSNPISPAQPDTETARKTSIGAALETRGFVILDDLTFETGSSDLGPGSYASLAELAAFLNAHPGSRVALVGHTDAQGQLDRNIALSKRRASSVRARLVADHDVNASQVDAEGMGYLAPVATNRSAEGRETNRRVEAVLLDTE